MIDIDEFEDEAIDFLCPMCDTPLLFGAQQEFGQTLSTRESLVIYGECPTCGETYTTIYTPDLEEMELLAEGEPLLL
jgi:predicted RNA-binding Zn-ribbon protein involved in translation (DUF1610 family)